MTWSLLQAAAAQLDPALLNLAFIFLLIGYGTKVGLAPLHAWLPDAHAEGPTPISAVLSGLLLNVALYALLRFKMLVAGHPAALDPGPIMIVMGLVSLIFAAFMLYQRRDIKRFFAYSSIEHMGLITFAFGMGGPLANFAGPAAHGHAQPDQVGASSSPSATSRRPRARQRIRRHPRPQRHPSAASPSAFALAVVAIAGLPPFGVFMSEFLILTTTFAREPWLALLPAFGLLVGFGALLLRLQGMIFGEPAEPAHRVDASSVPLVLHLLLVLVAGHLPAAGPGRLVPARRGAARMSAAAALALADLVGDRPAAPTAMCGSPSPPTLDGAGRGLRGRAMHDLGALWADDGRMRLALGAPSRGLRAIVSFETDAGRYPSVAARHLPALRLERAVRDLYGVAAELGCPTRDRGSITAAGLAGRARRATNSCRPRARGCIRSLSGRSMPASSNRAISASPPTARPWCGSKSGWAMCTRASRA